MPATMSLYAFMAERHQQVGDIVSVLRGDYQKGRPVHGLLQNQGRMHVISTYDELREKEGAFRDWKLRAFINDFWFQYFEIWQPTSRNANVLRLRMAYLNVFRVNPDTKEKNEHVCIHCDPFEEPDLVTEDGRTEEQKKHACQFKRGPHLHVKNSTDLTLPHSHFPLNLGHLRAVLSRADGLTREIRRAAEVVRDEVLIRSMLRERLGRIA